MPGKSLAPIPWDAGWQSPTTANSDPITAASSKGARRNKVHAYGTICGWRVAAIDGTETFCTQSPTAEALKWSKRTLSNGAIEYYERAAVLSYIGAHPPPDLGHGAH